MRTVERPGVLPGAAVAGTVTLVLGTVFALAVAYAFVLSLGSSVDPPDWARVAGLVWLALAASALAFSLYFPVVRKIGPGRAAYSSAIVPIVAMALSTLFEGYRWTPLAAAGAALAIGVMLLAMMSRRPAVAAPAAD